MDKFYKDKLTKKDKNEFFQKQNSSLTTENRQLLINVIAIEGKIEIK